MALEFKTLTVHIAGSGETFRIALLNGSEPSALLDAVRGRVGQSISGASMYFTTGPEAAGTKVDLSAALPDGAEVTLHRQADPNATASPTAQQDKPARQTSGVRRMFSGGGQRRGRSSSRDMPARQTSGIQDDAGDDKPRRRSSSAIRRLWSKRGGNGDESDSSGPVPWKKYDSEVAEDRKANQAALDAIQRFARIGVDYGTEDTGMGWHRTCLAAMRTVFQFCGLLASDNKRKQGILTPWDATVYAGLVTCFIYTTLTGTLGHARYVRMKKIIAMKVIPFHYQRVSLRWSTWMLLVCSILVMFGVCSWRCIDVGKKDPSCSHAWIRSR